MTDSPAAPLRVGVLDQSPVLSGHTAAEAIHETLELARLAESLGYHRYWLAEHHAIAALADPCPEILLGQVAAITRRMRVGTGGVLMPYYSPLKVAEIFRMHEALFPGRIDLGLGRAPGGDMRTAQALSRDAFDAAERFPEQVQELVGHLDGTLPASHPHAGLRVQPAIDHAPEVWLLGSSDYSGALAAHLGLRFAFAQFISAQGGDSVMRDYRAHYRPSSREPVPYSIVCAFVICADTQAEAERLAKSVDLRRIHMAKGIESPVPTVEESEAYPWTEPERAYAQQQRGRTIIGDPGTVRQRLLALAERCQADELLVLGITGDSASRRHSYRLIAEAMELDPTAG